MAVQNIEHYRQQDGRDILKVIFNPTKNFPNGVTYVDACFEDLIKDYTWYAYADKLNDYVLATLKSCNLNQQKHLKLHQAIAFQCLGYYPQFINHINGIGLDNTCLNLDEVTQNQNIRCRQKRGYQLIKNTKSNGNSFMPRIAINRKNIYRGSSTREDTACIRQFNLEAEYYNDYNYNFLLDRRGDLDILDLERTGKISAEEATFRHVMRYAKDNAWYIFRYNLEDYFKAYNVALPAYSLNIEGRMVHPVTGQILCPFG